MVRKSRRLVAIGLAAGLVAVGCGSDEDDAADTTVAPTTAAAPATTTAAPATSEAAPETSAAAPDTTAASPDTTEPAPDTTDAPAPTATDAPDTTAADAAAWDAIVDAAAGQSVMLYHHTSEAQFTRFAEAFNAKYPDITIAAERGGRPLLERLTAEIAAGDPGADVLIFSDAAYFEQNSAEFTEELMGPNAAAFPSEWLVADRYPVIQILSQSLLAWNTNEFPEGFETFQDVLEIAPGRLGLRNIYSGALCAYYDYLEEQHGPGYLEALGALEPVAYGQTTETAQAVASGEIGITIEGQPANFLALQAEGAPVGLTIIEEPGFGQPFQAGILSKSENQEAAQVFLDFLLSPEGQEAWNSGGYAASVLPDIPDTASVDGFELFDASQYPPEKVAECEATIESVVFGR